MDRDGALKRFAELARRGACTRFLEPALFPLASGAAREEGVSVAFSGGYPGAERQMAAFFAEGAAPRFPIAAVRAEWNAKYASPGHRDLLGAAMALGVERDVLGDILVHDGFAHILTLSEVAEFVASGLDSAGRARLRASVETGEIPPPQIEGERFRETAPSTRMDAVLAAALNISREKAQKLIAQGMVKRNYLEELRADVRMKEGDLLSARGYGRIALEQILGETRKGRVALMLFRYGK